MDPMRALPVIETLERPMRAGAPDRDPVRPVLDPKRILIVDDDALVRSSLAAVLHCEGYEAYGADDGRAAIKSAIEHNPDLVLLDLNMPNMDGWTAFTKLEETRPLIPVIVITARPNQYKHAVKLGMDAFMEKPLNFPVLLRAIRKLTYESEDRRTKRITNPGFVTRLLDNHTQSFS
jgi:two-component system, OmpR family, response regulator